MKISNFTKYLILLLFIVNNSYTMNFNDDKPLNDCNTQTKLNELQTKYSDMMIALSMQLECDGHNVSEAIIKIDKIYKDNILVNIFLSQNKISELYRNKLENEGYGYLCNYYKAICDIFNLRQYIEIIHNSNLTLIKNINK